MEHMTLHYPSQSVSTVSIVEDQSIDYISCEQDRCCSDTEPEQVLILKEAQIDDEDENHFIRLSNL